MIIPCIFGTTKGLEVLYLAQRNSIKLDDAWIGVTTSQVKLDPNADCFRMSRRAVGNQILTWIGVYRAVNEIGYNRGGGFYGAGVWLIEVTVDIELVTQTLTKLADQVKKLGQNGGQFVRTISEIKNALQLPSETAALLGSARPMSSGLSVDANSTAFFTTPTQRLAVLDWAQNSSAAECFGSVFVADADQFVPSQSKYGTSRQFSGIAAATESVLANLNGTLAKVSKENGSLRDQLVRLNIENKSLEASVLRLKADFARVDHARKMAERRRQTYVEANDSRHEGDNNIGSLITIVGAGSGLLFVAAVAFYFTFNNISVSELEWYFSVGMLLALAIGTTYFAIRFFVAENFERWTFATTLLLCACFALLLVRFLTPGTIAPSLSDNAAKLCEQGKRGNSADGINCKNQKMVPQSGPGKTATIPSPLSEETKIPMDQASNCQASQDGQVAAPGHTTIPARSPIDGCSPSDKSNSTSLDSVPPPIATVPNAGTAKVNGTQR
jgi:hypothetical protein